MTMETTYAPSRDDGMSTLLSLLTLDRTDEQVWRGPGTGQKGKRSFGGLFAAQSLAAAVATVDPTMRPASLHIQFLRGGDAGDGADYRVEQVLDEDSSAVRSVQTRQGDRLLATATASFAAFPYVDDEPARDKMPPHPDTLPMTGPPGPAPSLPPNEFDIRVDDVRVDGQFVRRLWWRTLVPLPDEAVVHTLVAVYVTDLYGVDPILQVHGHSMADRTLRSGTTDASMWFLRPVRAGEWNLLESRSPAAANGRGVMTADLLRWDGTPVAKLVHEGLIAFR